MDLKRPEKMVGQVTWLSFIGSKKSLHYDVAFREIEVCAPFHHRRRRSPHGIIGHGHPVHACVKEKKEVKKTNTKTNTMT